MTTIRLVGYLKEIAGFHEREFDISTPTPLNDLIDFPDLPEDRIVVLINEKGGKMNSLVTDSDKIKILPVIGGGRNLV